MVGGGAAIQRHPGKLGAVPPHFFKKGCLVTKNAGTYTPEEAAEFLKISKEDLEQLTRDGKIRMHQHSRRLYYLGGELDSAKSVLSQSKLF